VRWYRPDRIIVIDLLNCKSTHGLSHAESRRPSVTRAILFILSLRGTCPCCPRFLRLQICVLQDRISTRMDWHSMSALKGANHRNIKQWTTLSTKRLVWRELPPTIHNFSSDFDNSCNPIGTGLGDMRPCYVSRTVTTLHRTTNISERFAQMISNYTVSQKRPTFGLV